MSGRFPRALDLGCRTGLLSRLRGGHGGIETLVGVELSPAMAARHPGPVAVGDEERLPFGDGRFDLVLSNLALHWINDLPGALIQARRVLRPDGLFLAALLGGATLAELRDCLLAAEAEVAGGARPRVSPVTDVRDAGMLMQRAGFALPVVDSDTLTVTYDNALALMRDLRAMGETGALAERPRHLTRRATLLAAAARYQDRFAGADGRIEASFQVIFLTGWAPAASQPQPLRPGSARHRLADALGVEERPAEPG